MCGIVGYSGARNAVRVLLEGLSALEYRGYDSAGVSVFTENGLQTVKSAGRLAVVAERLASHPLPGCCGIGHTRWATHGEPSDANAHPHGTARLSLVHNGIIENYAELKMELSAQGYTDVYKRQRQHRWVQRHVVRLRVHPRGGGVDQPAVVGILSWQLV